MHANVGAQDGSFLVPRPVLVRGRDFVLDPTGILVEGGGRRIVPALPPVVEKLGKGGVLVVFRGFLGWIVGRFFLPMINLRILATNLTCHRFS